MVNKLSSNHTKKNPLRKGLHFASKQRETLSGCTREKNTNLIFRILSLYHPSMKYTELLVPFRELLTALPQRSSFQEVSGFVGLINQYQLLTLYPDINGKSPITVVPLPYNKSQYKENVPLQQCAWYVLTVIFHPN